MSNSPLRMRHRLAYKLLHAVAKPVTKHLFNYEYEKIPEIEGPYLLLSNHNTDWDPALLALAAEGYVSFVATEKLTRMGFAGKLLSRYFDPILHYKGKQGMRTVRQVISRMEQGINVAMFPEGNRSFNGLTCPIPPATAKLAKSCGGTLVTYRLTGGYFSSPRWGKGFRKGSIKGEVAGIYTADVLREMSDDEVLELLKNDLQVDAYADQKKRKISFRGKNRALGMESTLFMCPSCKALGSLKSLGNRIRCACGYDAEYDEYGYINNADGSVNTITELDEVQREEIEKAVASGTDKPLFSDTVVSELINSAHKVIMTRKATLEAYCDRLVLAGRQIPYSELAGIAINQRNLLILHVNGYSDHYECSGPISFNALKYLYAARASVGSRSGIL